MMSEKFLTPEELLEFTIQEKDTKILSLEKQVTEKDFRCLETEIALLNAQFALKRRLLEERKKDVKSSVAKLNNLKTKTKKYSDKLKKKYKLKDRWGFNPDTGEIITE